ncbi:hypothetical protein PENNAL_c0009G10222 [Penicillium nalgiovense]|uniref:Uncharacterized protein n=1 Tax=Penicillium nalgiovense TaxID=60175 RepID=A0A1V6YW09_PENNA|nr:hypothetical protein PENNAL_c0009G10222 [Penicillium nalgiovense]
MNNAEPSSANAVDSIPHVGPTLPPRVLPPSTLTKAPGRTLNWLPEGGRGQLADDIIIAKDDETLWEVFVNLRTAIIEIIRLTGKTPCVTPSPHHGRQSSDQKVATKAPDPETRSPDFTKGCIDRDGHRCVISGAVTETEWVKNGEVEGELWGKLEVYREQPPINATGESVVLLECKPHELAARERVRENAQRLIDAVIAKKPESDRAIEAALFEQT